MASALFPPLTRKSIQPYSPNAPRTDPEGTTLLRPSHETRASVRTPLALALLTGLLSSATPAPAAKWRHCPSQLRYYHAKIGAVSAPFVHPGHEVGIFLSDQEMVDSGPFSTEPGGNTVTVTFASLFGPRITLAPMPVSAVSPATLYFTFPARHPAYPPLRAVKKVDLFIGDFFVNGSNYYGNKVGRLAVSPIPHGLGVMLCGRNDALQVVLRAPGWRRWTRPWSPFSAWMPSSQPMEIQLSRMSVSEVGSASTGLDAFAEECLLQ